MQLKEFIHQSLTQIVKGIANAQKDVLETGARINPSTTEAENSKTPILNDPINKGFSALQNIEFDVAITVTEGSEDKIGGGLKIAAFGIGGETKAENKNSTISRLKFTVPMIFPVSAHPIADTKKAHSGPKVSAI